MFLSTIVAASPPPNLKYYPSVKVFTHPRSAAVKLTLCHIFLALPSHGAPPASRYFEVRLCNFCAYFETSPNCEFSSRSEYYIALPFKLFLLTLRWDIGLLRAWLRRRSDASVCAGLIQVG